MKSIHHIQKFNEHYDNTPAPAVIYLLTSDGHRDSVNFQKGAKNEAGIKILLSEEIRDILGEVIIDSIRIDHEEQKIFFQYRNWEQEIESGTWFFFVVELI